MKHVDMRKLPAAAQEERRRQVIGLRQAGMTYEAIAAQAGLTRTGVFNICLRFAGRGAAGLKSGPRGPEPGHGRFLDAEQEAAARDLIRRHTPDELDLPCALWSRAAVRRWLRRDYPAIAARAKVEGGAVFWGDETGLRSDDVRGRSYAPRGRTPEVRVNHKRAGLGLISAVTNKGELRWMVLDGAVKAPSLLRFLARLVREADRPEGLPRPRSPAGPPLRQASRLAGRTGGRDRGVLPARLQPRAEPGRGGQRRPEAGGHPQGAGAQQGPAQARRHRAHAQAVEAARPGPQLLRAQDLPLRRVVQDSPARGNRGRR